MKNCFKTTAVILASVLFAGTFNAAAESREHRDSTRHEVRIGWGDQMFEKLIWQEPQYIVSNMDESYRRTYREHWRYSQHWFAEYSWRVNRWFGIGAMLDASGCVWDEVTRNGLGAETARSKGHNFWNLTLMPTCRFSWFNSQYVSLYSSPGDSRNSARARRGTYSMACTPTTTMEKETARARRCSRKGTHTTPQSPVSTVRLSWKESSATGTSTRSAGGTRA